MFYLILYYAINKFSKDSTGKTNAYFADTHEQHVFNR